jgi:hypothetical protein
VEVVRVAYAGEVGWGEGERPSENVVPGFIVDIENP